MRNNQNEGVGGVELITTCCDTFFSVYIIIFNCVCIAFHAFSGNRLILIFFKCVEFELAAFGASNV